MHEMVEHITVCDLSPAISPQQRTSLSLLGRQNYYVLAHSWVRWIVTTTNAGMRHSLLQFWQTALQGGWRHLGLPHWLSRIHFPTNFAVSLWLCPEMRDVNFFRWLQSSSGMGKLWSNISCEFTCPTSWQGKMNLTPWCKQDLTRVTQIHSGSWTLVTIFLGRVNTETFSECDHRNELISLPWAYDKGSTKGIYFNRGLIT